MKAAIKTALVVGSGIAGLTAAYRLKQAGYKVCVLESERQLGGRMSCCRVGGFTFNRGATALGGGYDYLKQLITKVGLGDVLQYKDITIGTFRGDRVYPIRTNRMFTDSLLSGSLSWRSKLLMARLLSDTKRAEPYLDFADLSSAAPIDTETVAEYAERRLNDELLKYVVDPAMAAVLATTPEKASVVDLLFSISQFIGMGVYSFEGGIDFLVQELARQTQVETGARVNNVEETQAGVEANWEQGGEEFSATFDACVISTSAHDATKICSSLPKDARDILQGYEYSNIINCQFGVDYDPDVKADYIQIPQCEIPGMIILLFPHRLSSGVAPAGKGIVTACSIHDWSNEHLNDDDDAIIEAMLPNVERVVPDIRSHIEVTNVTRWTPALFASRAGSYKDMKRLIDSIDPRSKIQLAGDYFSFSSTNASAISGDRAVKRIIDADQGTS